MGRIARLPEDLIDKIAAGEVVERPASVVKELAENALDAGATLIRVAVEDGGLRRITIRDDGHGMSREDALLAVERHATSKLRSLEGLFAIRTMGFRGEALPSIASVSRFTLQTSEAGAELGTRLVIEGGRGPEVEDAAPFGGTAIDVEDLFFNTPARRKFLKREETELKHIEEAVIRLALAHPEVGFQLESDGRILFASGRDASLEDRVSAAVGPEARAHLLPVADERLGLSVRGVAAGPEFSLNNARGLYTFVNRRYVRDRGLNHAIGRAFQEGLPPGRQPVAALFLELEPSTVDVNVHPQKLEVRFADPRGVYDAVNAAVARALRNGASPVPAATASAVPAEYALAVDRFLARAQGGQSLFPPVAADAPFFTPQSGGFGQARPGINEAPPPGVFRGLRTLGQLGGRFWVCEGQGGTLVVIDPHAARERAVLHTLRTRFAKGAPLAAQASLLGAVVEVTAPLRSALLNRQPALERLGIRVESFGGDSIRVENLPAPLEGEALRLFLTELAETLPTGTPTDHVDAYASALRAIACRSAGAEGGGEEERRALFAALEDADFSVQAQHQSVVLFELPLLELEAKAR